LESTSPLRVPSVSLVVDDQVTVTPYLLPTRVFRERINGTTVPRGDSPIESQPEQTSDVVNSSSNGLTAKQIYQKKYYQEKVKPKREAENQQKRDRDEIDSLCFMFHGNALAPSVSTSDEDEASKRQAKRRRAIVDLVSGFQSDED